MLGPSKWWRDHPRALVVDAPVAVKLAQGAADTTVLQSCLSFVGTGDSLAGGAVDNHAATVGAPPQPADPDLQVLDLVTGDTQSFNASKVVTAEAINTPR